MRRSRGEDGRVSKAMSVLGQGRHAISSGYDARRSENSVGQAIFNNIIAYHSTSAKKSGKCTKNLRGETGSRFIHISPRP